MGRRHFTPIHRTRPPPRQTHLQGQAVHPLLRNKWHQDPHNICQVGLPYTKRLQRSQPCKADTQIHRARDMDSLWCSPAFLLGGGVLTEKRDNPCPGQRLTAATSKGHAQDPCKKRSKESGASAMSRRRKVSLSSLFVAARLVLLILRHQVVHVGLRLRELHLIHTCRIEKKWMGADFSSLASVPVLSRFCSHGSGS